MELRQQRCKPCGVGTKPLGPDDAGKLAERVPNWTLAQTHIERTFEFADFLEAMRFTNAIAEIAEKENHHPDLHISWGKVRVELSTHSIGGLSENDFIVAAKIDKLLE